MTSPSAVVDDDDSWPDTAAVDVGSSEYSAGECGECMFKLESDLFNQAMAVAVSSSL